MDLSVQNNEADATPMLLGSLDIIGTEHTDQ